MIKQTDHAVSYSVISSFNRTILRQQLTARYH